MRLASQLLVSRSRSAQPEVTVLVGVVFAASVQPLLPLEPLLLPDELEPLLPDELLEPVLPLVPLLLPLPLVVELLELPQAVARTAMKTVIGRRIPALYGAAPCANLK